MKEKLTPLSPPSITPVREGVYAVSFSFGQRDQFYSRWWRGKWRMIDSHPRFAALETTQSGWCYANGFEGWRGLAEKPGGGE